MKFKSVLVEQGTGSVGNLVVERNAVIRNRVNPANPKTLLQAAVRATLGAVAATWSSGLTAAKRTAWNVYAGTIVRKDPIGITKKLSGFQMFVGANAALRQASLGEVTDAPSATGSLAVPNLLSVVIDDSANTLVLTFGEAVPATTTILLSLSPGSLSQGRTKYSGPFRFEAAEPGTGINTVTFTSITLPAVAEVWGWRFIGVDAEGRVSNEAFGLTTVVA